MSQEKVLPMSRVNFVTYVPDSFTCPAASPSQRAAEIIRSRRSESPDAYYLAPL